jgi:hypothetical protein
LSQVLTGFSQSAPHNNSVNVLKFIESYLQKLWHLNSITMKLLKNKKDEG